MAPRDAKVSKQAIGIVRVSRVNGREGDSFRSPATQRERIEEVTAQHGWRLVKSLGVDGVFEELDVSGSKGLADRAGLRQAVEAVEQGRVSVVVVAYFDRLCRDPRVRDDVLDRVEAAGGEVWAADMGRQSNGTAAERFTGGVLAQAAKFVLDSAAEKARAAQVEAVEAGIWMSPAIPPGYVLGEDRHLARDPKAAPVVAEAFRMRAERATIEAIRLHLLAHGIERSHKGVGKLLHSRAVLGELHFGELHNPTAHPAIVDRNLWRRVQAVSVPRGPVAKSERLLARLGVLRCGTCGSRMSVSSSNLNKYPTYRCGQRESCERRQTISGPPVEQAVVDYVQTALEGIGGFADARPAKDEAAQELERTEHIYQAAVEALDPTEPAEVERLAAFREARNAARERYEEQRADAASLGVAVTAGDWHTLSVDARRDLIRAVIERVEVHPGRGAERLVIVPKGGRA